MLNKDLATKYHQQLATITLVRKRLLID